MTDRSLEFDVYGTQVLVLRERGHWSACYIGADGKRRSAKDIVIPVSVAEADLAQYLADLCHEGVTERHPNLRRSK